MVSGGVLGKETGAGRRDKGVAHVGQDKGFAGDGVVRDDADAELVGGAFASESDAAAFGVGHCCWLLGLCCGFRLLGESGAVASYQMTGMDISLGMFTEDLDILWLLTGVASRTE